MKRRLFGTLCAAWVLSAAVPAWAQGGADDAVALVKRAVAYYQEKGGASALAEFNNPQGLFVDKNLFLFAIDLNGTVVANNANPWAVGKKILESKDGQGKYYIKAAIELSKTEQAGWVDYVWPNPGTRAQEPKSLYVERVDTVLVGCSVAKK